MLWTLYCELCCHLIFTFGLVSHSQAFCFTTAHCSSTCMNWTFWVMMVTCSVFVVNWISCVFVSDSLLWGSKLFDVEPAITQVCKWTLLEAEYVSMLYARWLLCQRMNWVCTLARNVSTEAQWTLVLSCHQSTVMLLWLQGLLLHVAAPVIYYSACQHLFMLLAFHDFLSTPDICS